MSQHIICDGCGKKNTTAEFPMPDSWARLIGPASRNSLGSTQDKLAMDLCSSCTTRVRGYIHKMRELAAAP